MSYSPNSTVHLCSVPLDNSYNNQLYFSGRESQYSFFSRTIVHTFNDLSYVRKDNKVMLTIDKHIDKLWNVNYVMYKNTEQTSKWFYAFITSMEYVSERSTNIVIETDVYQTWLTECRLRKSFVVREHVSNDGIGQNLIDENLEIGEYKMRTEYRSNQLDDISYVIALSEVLGETTSETNGNIYSGVYSGLTYWRFKPNKIFEMNDFINHYISKGKGDAIAYIFTIPSIFLPDTVTGRIPSGTNASGFNWDIGTNYEDIDGYKPKNNKLFNYPYNCLYASNNQGGSAIYKFEDFNLKDVVSFSIIGNIAPNPTLMLCPSNFKGQPAYNQEYGLSMGGYPLCAWNNDTFGAYLAQNSMTIGMGFVGSAISTAVGVATLNPIAIVGGVGGAIGQMAQITQKSIQPDQARGNINGGGLNIASGSQSFKITKMTIRKEIAEIIDNFFNMYGYKVNKIKVPNIHTRKYWNYVKTNDVNIIGDIPMNDMIKLKTMYNNGVTFWHDANFFCNYELDNIII